MKTSVTLPGVFVSVYQQGCLIKGPSCSGKSELALSLIDRGHQLISDDSVTFYKEGDKNITGVAPTLLKNRLHIRELGVLNIKNLFGAQAKKNKETLSYIIELNNNSNQAHENILQPNTATESILEVTFPILTLTPHPSRYLALMVETFVKNGILSEFGRDSTKEFMLDHQKQLEAEKL